jgi:hypothetical protein
VQPHYLIRTEVRYPGFNNIADLWITYDDNDGADPSNIAMELKVDFNAGSVNQDIELLDAQAGLQNPPFDNGYACYTFQNAGWTGGIDNPIEGAVRCVPIEVVF